MEDDLEAPVGSPTSSEGSTADDDTGRRRLLLGGTVAVVILGIGAVLAVLVGAVFIGATSLTTVEDPDAPEVRFEFTEADTEVRITHAGGDSVRASSLLLLVSGVTRSWAAAGDATPDDRIGPGDSVSIAAQRGDTVRVLWRGGVANIRLAEYEVQRSGADAATVESRGSDRTA